MEVEVEVELEAKLEVELGLQAAALVDVGDGVQKSFITPVHNSSIDKSVHNSFMTAVWVL